MTLNTLGRCWFGLMLLYLFWGCAPMSYDKLMPENYTPAFQNGLKANLEVEPGPQPCILGGPFAVPPKTFKQALIHTAGDAIDDSPRNLKYTLLVKDYNCCLENNDVTRTPCTTKCYWAVRDNTSNHLIWQQYIEETGIGTFHIDGGKRIKEAISNSTRQTIKSGLTALAQVDLAAAEGQVLNLVEQWNAQRSAAPFKALYEHLFFSARKRIQRDRDGYQIDLYGNLMAPPSKAYVTGLMGEPDEVLPGAKGNETLEWRFEDAGKETAYRLSFFQNLLSGGTIRKKK